ncbi:phosphatidate cytidylyltransferase [Erysipelothrix aquatica]|uniref:phosphatidate cytidylyltransferase n=1 Tax=Erysipelothrix aquatica TaxID=2683714 RepID=UPI00135A45E0|nr:phosphatidate cytidylyltransferase [Erysipelothrix aquatica]
MKERLITGIALIVVFGTAILMGNQALFLLLLAVVTIGAYEIYRLKKDEMKPIILPLLIVSTILGGLLGPEYLSVFIMGWIMTLFVLTVVFDWFDFSHVNYIFVMVMMLVAAIQAVKVVLSFNTITFLFILLATYVTDAAAYFGGRHFGKHKLIERISPKKTIEGAVIGYVASATIALIFGHIFVIEYVPAIVVYLSAVLIPIMGQFGDLAFSLIKRYFNVKDFGYIFPGHGGILDRVDSVIFALFTFNILLQIFV